MEVELWTLDFSVRLSGPLSIQKRVCHLANWKDVCLVRTSVMGYFFIRFVSEIPVAFNNFQVKPPNIFTAARCRWLLSHLPQCYHQIEAQNYIFFILTILRYTSCQLIVLVHFTPTHTHPRNERIQIKMHNRFFKICACSISTPGYTFLHPYYFYLTELFNCK